MLRLDSPYGSLNVHVERAHESLDGRSPCSHPHWKTVVFWKSVPNSMQPIDTEDGLRVPCRLFGWPLVVRRLVLASSPYPLIRECHLCLARAFDSTLGSAGPAS
jgi:hypothetical protein